MNILDQIQDEAKKKTSFFLEQNRLINQPILIKPEIPKEPEVKDNSLELFQKEVAGLAKEVSRKASANYIGNLISEMQDIASERISSLTSFDSVIQNNDGSVGFYPNNCRMYSKLDNGGIMVIEEPPQIRTIFYEEHYKMQKARIALPYLVFIIKFREENGKVYYTNSGVGFSPKSVTSLNDYIYNPNLPHCTTDFICNPVTGNGKDSIKELVDSFFQTFWESSFVYEFVPFYISENSGSRKKGIKIKSFAEWQALKDPLSILKTDFTKPMAIANLIEHFVGSGRTTIEKSLQKIRGTVQNITSDLLQSVDANSLADLIQKTVQTIVEKAIRNIPENSGLQSE